MNADLDLDLDPFIDMNQKIAEAKQQLLMIGEAALVLLAGFAVLFIALRILAGRANRRREDRMLEKYSSLVQSMIDAGARRVQMYDDEPLFDPTEEDRIAIATSNAINHAFDQDPTVLDDPEIYEGVEVKMAVLATEHYELCPQCGNDHAVAVTMALEKTSGEPVSIIRSIACSSCSWKLVS
jgi:hypothetical protein